MVLRGFSILETGAAQTRSIPEWSTEHFETTGRPLRIAVDQANWWLRNITAARDADIKSKYPGTHPREKRIMERIIYLLRMNIQLLFIFDGSEKPPREWPASHCYAESNVRLLKELLDQLGVPRHDAPGDSVAECVRLQELGVVDAMWTDNTDALMFGGSPTLVQFHRKKPEGDQFKNSNTVTVSSAAVIRERANLTRQWFLMYATLVGCGYTGGLDGFDANKFFRFAQHSCFQAAANLLGVAAETPLVLSKWRIIVTSIIQTTFPEGGVATPPRTFPELSVLRGYAFPAVSSDDVLRDLPCLRAGWFRPYGPDMLSRYRFLLSNFNTQIHESWVARDLVPIQLNHILLSTAAGEQEVNRRLGIVTRPKRKDTPTSIITINPLKVLPELLSAFPSEMYRVLNGSRVKIEAPVFRPEDIELLDRVLRRGLPESDVPRYIPPVVRSLSQDIVAAASRKKKPPPVPPPLKDETIKMFQPVSWSSAKRRPNPEKPQKSAFPVLPPIDTHLPVPLPLHSLDTSGSPTCIQFHEGLTLPGELEWHTPSMSSSTMPSSPLLLPVSRRASALAGKLSGPDYRKASIAITEPLPILKQPAWDHSAVIDLPELD
ncbi:hypothetical protein F4777DRAFT_579858 [Nemania sp. FL0916]|nr:hypothetical protein F4777DRAFT_579858 [Nemania sp. FL0916]